MKRFVIALLLIPSIAFAAFTEFYAQNGGSNLNAGSTNNNTADYTSTSGNWTQSTRVFTPTDSSTPASTVSVGMFASVYLNAASVAVYIGRVSAVGGGTNGTITIDGTANIGSAPSNSSGGMTIKVGGAWAGLTGSTIFPYSLGSGWNVMTNSSGDRPRINLKNDQTYTVTASAGLSAAGATTQGYSSSPGDLGKATITSNITSSFNFQITGINQYFSDLIFVNTGGSGSNDLANSQGGAATFERCVFHGGRGSGLSQGSGGSVLAIECESYGNNGSNSVDKGGFSVSSGLLVCAYCYSHDNTGSNSEGYVSSSGNLVLIDSISDTNGGNGARFSSSTGAVALSLNGDYYNNTGEAIKASGVASSAAQVVLLRNNNFIKNGGAGITSTQNGQGGSSENNGYGAGTQANGSADTLKSIGEVGKVTYASNVTPWNAPTTGDFSITLSAAQGAGRGAFTETDGTNTGTVGYPDIGAAQAQIGAPFPTPTPTATPTATPTSTPTPTSPPEVSHTFGS